MSWLPFVGPLISIGTSLLGANAQKKSAKSAANAEIQAAQMGIDEQSRQFDAIRESLAPYMSAGTSALDQQLRLLGLSGADAQKESISNIEQSPQFQSLYQQGENALLQNASATGGLRGGNVQGALAQYRPDLLSSLIESQYGKLSNLAGVGQNAAAQTGTFGQNASNNIADLLGQQGSAQASRALAEGQADVGVFNTINKAFNQYSGGQF